MRIKRDIASWVLLAVFVPMLILSSLHIHQTEDLAESSCTECIYHHCVGHLVQHTNTIHNCVLCQFLTLQFLAVAIATVILFKKENKPSYAQIQSVSHFDFCGIPTLRAPPSV